MAVKPFNASGSEGRNHIQQKKTQREYSQLLAGVVIRRKQIDGARAEGEAASQRATNRCQRESPLIEISYIKSHLNETTSIQSSSWHRHVQALVLYLRLPAS